METRYMVFQIAAFTINFVCWYYALVFCAVYSDSSRNWVYGGLTGLFVDWFVISLLIPLSKTLLRLGIRNFKYLRFLIVIEYFYFVIGLFT